MRQQQLPTPALSLGLRQSIQIQSSPNIKLFQQSPYQSPLIQPSHSQQRQPNQVSNFNNVNRSLINEFQQPCKQLQVVDLNSIEEPWKQKISELEQKIKQLEQNQIHQTNEDDSELSQVYSQIQQLANTIKILKEEIKILSDKLAIKQSIISGYDQQLQGKEKEIEDQNHYISELHNQLHEQTNQMEQKQKFLFDEITTWKKKFLAQNKELHLIQDEQIKLQTQVDYYKNIILQMNKQSEYKQS